MTNDGGQMICVFMYSKFIKQLFKYPNIKKKLSTLHAVYTKHEMELLNYWHIH